MLKKRRQGGVCTSPQMCVGILLLLGFMGCAASGPAARDAKALEKLQADVARLQKAQPAKDSRQDKRLADLNAAVARLTGEVNGLQHRCEVLEAQGVIYQEALLRAGAMSPAGKVQAQVAERYPEPRKEATLPDPKVLMERGRKAVAKSREAEALLAFEEALAVGLSLPMQAEALLAIGGVYQKLGDYRSAEATYRRLADTAGDEEIQARAQIERARCLEKLKRVQEARKILGYVQDRLGRTEAARDPSTATLMEALKGPASQAGTEDRGQSAP